MPGGGVVVLGFFGFFVLVVVVVVLGDVIVEFDMVEPVPIVEASPLVVDWSVVVGAMPASGIAGVIVGPDGLVPVVVVVEVDGAGIAELPVVAEPLGAPVVCAKAAAGSNNAAPANTKCFSMIFSL